MRQLNALMEHLLAYKINFSENEPLKNHTSFQIGGPARVFCCPINAQQVAAAVAAAAQSKVPCYLLGKGTNVLFRDEGYSGLVIHMGTALAKIEIQGNLVAAGAGARLCDVCLVAQQNSLAGMEFAYGIPGSVGGAIYMNAGAYGGEMCDIVESVTYLNQQGQVLTIPLAQLELGYRTSVFQTQPWCILSASYRLAKGDDAAILALMQDYMHRREDKQPLDLPSAGSAFKRPRGAFAGALIEQSGLRGFQVGGAGISQKHCGFIVNVGHATCEDVLNLASEVSRIVQEKTGFVLEKEIRVVETDASVFALPIAPL